MSLSLTVLIQVFIMFLLMLTGIICYKAKFLDDKGTEQLVKVLLYVVNVGIIMSAYNTDYSEKLAKGLLTAFGLAFLSHFVGMAFSYLIWRKRDAHTNSVLRFGVIYSNCGFMAIPLISAIYGSTGVFYASAYVIVFNFLTWTHGVLMMNSKSNIKENLKNLINPVIISVIIGLPVFFLQIPIPYPLTQTFKYIADLNTPLAMIIAGVYIIRSDIFSAFKCGKAYLVAFLRLLAVPFIMIFILKLLKIEETVAVTSLIASACPSATLVMFFSERFGADTKLAVRIFVLSTLFCIVTIPFIIWLFNIISV